MKNYFAKQALEGANHAPERVNATMSKKKKKEEEPKKVKPEKASKKKVVTGETAVAPKATKPRKAPVAKKKPAVVISNDDIALRAYFIAEHRNKLGLPGTEHGDWVEAERQLREEVAK